MRAGVGRGLAQRARHELGGRRVGVADAEADHVHAGGLLLGDLALELGEQVRGQAVKPLAGLHAFFSASRNSSLSVARVHGHGPAGQVDVQVLGHVHLQLAAVQPDGHGAVDPAQHRGHGGAGGAGARRHGLPHPALEDARADRGVALAAPERDVRAVREQLVALDRRAQLRQVELLEALVHLDRALGVADGHELEAQLASRRRRACRCRRRRPRGSPARTAWPGPCPRCRSRAR